MSQNLSNDLNTNYKTNLTDISSKGTTTYFFLQKCLKPYGMTLFPPCHWEQCSHLDNGLMVNQKQILLNEASNQTIYKTL